MLFALDIFVLRRAIVCRSAIEEFNTQPYFLVGLKPRDSPKSYSLAGDKHIGTHP